MFNILFKRLWDFGYEYMEECPEINRVLKMRKNAFGVKHNKIKHFWKMQEVFCSLERITIFPTGLHVTLFSGKNDIKC